MKEVVRKSNAEVIMLQEAKLKRFDRTILLQVCFYYMVDGICLSLRRALGGIWVFWNVSRVEIEVSFIGAFSVLIRGRLRA